jgi:thiamine-monophosphate kinase
MIAGVHFGRRSARHGRAKALRVNVPILWQRGFAAGYCWHLPCRAISASVDQSVCEWVEARSSALWFDACRWRTTATPGPLTICITAFGEVAQGRMLTRGGARVGDDVWVTGTIGDAALGLRVLKGTLELGEGYRRSLVAR